MSTCRPLTEEPLEFVENTESGRVIWREPTAEAATDCELASLRGTVVAVTESREACLVSSPGTGLGFVGRGGGGFLACAAEVGSEPIVGDEAILDALPADLTAEVRGGGGGMGSLFALLVD